MDQNESTVPLSLYQKSFDYLQVIRNWTQLSPLKFKFYYISSHDSDHVQYDDLDWWEKMNDKMDKKAKNSMTACTTMAPICVH